MILANLSALQVVVPLMAAPLCAVIPCRKLAWLFSCIITSVAAVISLALAYDVLSTGSVISYEMGNWPPPFGIEYRVDLLSAFVLVLVSGVGAITSIYAYSSVDAEIPQKKQPYFYALFLLCFAGLLGIVITNDAFNIYVFLEISSLATYALVSMGKDRRALMASFQYLVLGTIGATFILIAVGLLYMMTGTLNISDIAVRIPIVAHTVPVKAALAFFTVGLALKIAIFPLHVWLTNAYTNAPSFVVSFLSATATKVSIYVLIRVFFTLFGYKFSFEDLPLGHILMTLSLFAIFIGSLVAVFQHNVKRMLAYSSVAQIGYILLGVSLATQSGLTASLVHLFNHALAKAALFMVVGCVTLRTGGVRLDDFKGIGSRMPFTMAAFVVAGLSLFGLPMTAGFVSKWYLLVAVMEKGLWPVFVVIISSSVLALIYIWRIVEIAYFREKTEDIVKVEEAPLLMLVALWVMTLMSIVFGIYTSPVVGFASQVAGYLFGY